MIKDKVTYEWDIETIDIESGDILDHDFYDNPPALPTEPNKQLVLLKAIGNEYEGITTRLWAYVENGKLPEYFSDCGANGMFETSVKVPQRFHKELNRKERK